jgi:hypothetical protein
MSIRKQLRNTGSGPELTRWMIRIFGKSEFSLRPMTTARTPRSTAAHILADLFTKMPIQRPNSTLKPCPVMCGRESFNTVSGHLRILNQLGVGLRRPLQGGGWGRGIEQRIDETPLVFERPRRPRSLGRGE